MGDFFDFSMPDYSFGGDLGYDDSWMSDFQLETPDFAMDFSEPAYSFGADLDFGGADQYLPDFSLGGGGGEYNLFGYGGEPSIMPQGQYNLWAGLEEDYAKTAAAEMPDLGVGGGFESPGQVPFGSTGMSYDPSTGVLFDRAGNPVQPQGGGATTGGGTLGSVIGPVGSVVGGVTRALTQPTQQGGGSGGAGGQGGGSPWGSGILGSIDKALASPLGGLLAKGAVGAASLGIGKMLAGDAPKAPNLNLPPQSPTTKATEGALLDALNAGGRADLTRAAGQSIGGTADLSGLLRQLVNQEQATESQMQPGFADARMKALGLIPGQLDTSMDPVQAALQGELMKTIEGQANPIVEDQIRKDWAAFQNQMFRRLGPDWELSSAGQEAKQAFDRSAEQRRFGSRQETIRTLQPLQQSQMQATGGERRSNLAALTGATNLGRSDIYRTGTQLNTIAPVGAYLGGDPDRFRSLQANLETQSALLPYQAAQQERQQTMKGVADIGGTIAGGIGGKRLQDYIV